MTLPVGARLGRYEIKRLLGAGGMGEVYLARDPELARDVALKILPSELVESSDRVQRFVLEARAASALNHPYILTVHEIGKGPVGGARSTSAGAVVHYIAMEFVEGVNLRARLQDGQVGLLERLEYLTQVAEGLVKAHAAGIVHRDLKPENIMVSRDRFIKILDFGLAKLVGESGSVLGSEPDAATAMSPGFRSQPGLVLGTAAYMSPEQARGKPVDTRSDIFSFGCILYEAATGRQPFSGDSLVATLHSVIHEDVVPPRQLNSSVTGELERIVLKCLTKDPEERYQTIKDVAIDLKALRRDSASLVQPLSPAAEEHRARGIAGSAGGVLGAITRDKRRTAAAASVLAVVIVAAFAASGRLDRPESRSPRFEMAATRLTSTGNVTRAAISADGKYAVHVIEEGGKQGLWIRQVATASHVNVLPPTDATYLGVTFSKDGDYVFYVRRETTGGRGVVYRMPTLGGASAKLLEGVDGAITLAPDGRRFAFVRYEPSGGQSALIVAAVDGGAQRTIATRQAPGGFGAEGPAWSPDGTVIAAVEYSGDTDEASTLVAIDAQDGRKQQILQRSVGAVLHAAWTDGGTGLFVSVADRTSSYMFQIWHVGYPGGNVRRITTDLNSYSDVSVTSDGKTLLAVQGDWTSNLWVAATPDFSDARRVSSGKYDGAFGVAWTPDGRIVHATRTWDIWITDAGGGNQKLLTPDEHNNRWVSVTPDGRYILFESWRKGADSGLWRMDIDGANPRPLTTRGWASHPRVSPNSKWVVYSSTASGTPAIWRASIEGGQEQQLTTGVTEHPAISPDGRLVACYSASGVDIRFLVIPFDGGAPVFEAKAPEGIRTRTAPGFTPDGRALTYVLDRGGVSNIWAQPLDGSPPVQVTHFESDRIFAFDWARDGRLLVSRGSVPNDVILFRALD